MDHLERQVEQLNVSMDIIDGNNLEVQQSCTSLIKILNDNIEQANVFQSLLEEYEQQLQEQRDMCEELDELKMKLLYIQETFPAGIINVTDEDKCNDITQNVECMEYAQPKNLFNVSSKEKSVAAKNVMQVKNTPKGQSRNNINSSSLSVTRGELNLMSPYDIYKPFSSKVPSPATSKSDLPKVKVTHDISINYVTEEEFSLLSSYMRGRLTLTNINEFVDIFNNTLNSKYDLLKKPKKTKSSKDQEQCLIWKEQETGELVGSYFCTAEDLDHLSSIKIGNRKYLNIITILRHLKRLKEVRGMKKSIFYVACF